MKTIQNVLVIGIVCVILGFSCKIQAQEMDIPDQWYLDWFGTTDLYGPGDDPDNDELINYQEYRFGTAPISWDSDGDLLDDYWEQRYNTASPRLSVNLDPMVFNIVTADSDGDGLSIWQEYYGVNDEQRMWLDRVVTNYSIITNITVVTNTGTAVTNIVISTNGFVLAIGKKSGTVDDLSPITIDTDHDYLLDSFEVAWYDPGNGIDPLAGDDGTVTGAVAHADSDEDGLSNYREQCLLMSLRMGETNGEMWDWPREEKWPFVYTDFTTEVPGVEVLKIVTMSYYGSALNLGLEMDQPTYIFTNRYWLRNHEWTDPTEGTGYIWVDEDIPKGHDTDEDSLPDGWEVEFGLDPRDPGTVLTGWTNGPWGDPDGDGIQNWYEYLGQDGERFANKPYINGTGDETNPNQHRWRPDSTYIWRWYPENAPYDWLLNPKTGQGYNRDETLGAALPTAALTNGIACINTNGYDIGTDSDDDGLTDNEEIEINLQANTNAIATSPVDSCDPFIQRSALITSSAGIPVPDPEPAVAEGLRPAGMREDLQRRDWTIECMVKLVTTNLNGYLFNFMTQLGPTNRVIYRLALENGRPAVYSQNQDGTIFSIQGNVLPENQWIHLAASWDHANNVLSLFIGGMVAQQKSIYGECASALLYPATNSLTLAESPDGTFVNNLYLDEVRIWGIPRTPAAINEYAERLIPQGPGDDVWLGTSNEDNCYYPQYSSVLVDGGSLFVGQPGVKLDNLRMHYVDTPSDEYYWNFWLDDGDGIYNKSRDQLVYLVDDPPLKEGQVGKLISDVDLDGFPYVTAYYNDKDGSGSFSFNTLLAYYRFDDGGQSMEDFSRKAKSGLLDTSSEDYRFGDHGYSLATNNFAVVTTGVAKVYGATIHGADDADEDGMPDGWEVVNHLDSYDNGSGQETALGAKNGPFGPLGDPDGDGLRNIYEFWARTNPRADKNSEGEENGQMDYDGDNLVNNTEQELDARPDLIDTDDDGYPDNIEQGNNTSPANPADPPLSRAMAFGGSSADYVQIPLNQRYQLQSWTLDAAVQPTDLSGGTIIRRVVQHVAGTTNAMNYYMGLEDNGSGGLQIVCGYVQLDGTEYVMRAGDIPVGTSVWTYVSASYSAEKATMKLYTNGALVAVTNDMFRAPPRSGKGGETYVRIGESFSGNLDEIRVWDYERTETEINEDMYKTLQADTTGLVGYFRFNDGQATTNYYPFGPYHQPAGPQDYTYEEDWNDQWRHAGIINGDVQFIQPGAGRLPALVYVYLEAAAETPAGYWEADRDLAAWTVDSISTGWRESGQSIALEVDDTYLIRFQTVNGWNKPDNVSLTISNGSTLYLTNYYRYVGASTSGAYCVSGEIINSSDWTNGLSLPGDGSGLGQIVVGIWSSDSDPIGKPITNQTRLSRAPCQDLPNSVDYGMGPLPALATYDYYQLRAWIDGDGDQSFDIGEPASEIKSIDYLELPSGVLGVNLEIMDDTDNDDLPDWYEVFSFGNLAENKTGDYDNDGLNNYEEYNIPNSYANIPYMNGGNFDSDGDGMDDKWEYDRYAGGYGLNPATNDAWLDIDGDGLYNVQEYLGVDGIPRLEQDPAARTGVALTSDSSSDDLDPRNYDTDSDGLVDCFEFTWYDAAQNIDPKTNQNVNIAADLDFDGMSTYREQCLLGEFSQGGSNDLWSIGTNAMPGANLYGVQAFNPPLTFMVTGVTDIATVRALLKLEEWTDPVDADTDGDLLPDGWEVEFNLNPKSVVGNNGYWGDPDSDSLINYVEYRGQDETRSTNHVYINGSGDETNPNEYNWVLPSTGPGAGISRPAVSNNYWSQNNAAPTNGTLGAGRPTVSLGNHAGTDTDDDGYADAVEIQQEYYNQGSIGSSPVHSMSPFVKRSVLITNAAGMKIPDPEGVSNGFSPLLHSSSWTIECYVKCLATNSTGYLINNPGPISTTQITYRLELSNNVPIVSFDTISGFRYQVSGLTLPTNQWLYLAGVWDSSRNSLSLYVDGIFVQEQRVYEGALSGFLFGSSTNITLGHSPNGSFANTLMMDEIRIWTKSRTADEIEDNRQKLLVQTNDHLAAYFRFDDGGSSAEDFARKAMNTALGADQPEYYYGDMGYALTSGFALYSNDYADVIGTDWRGADDSDNDGMPDAWEMINHLDPYSTNGVNGADADPDEDQLKNIYEYWSDTNPWREDTDGNSVLDRAEDRDGDTVVNGIEQQLLSRPDLVDTDDDGLTDNEERNSGSNPADPVDPAVGRALALGGSAVDYLSIPSSSEQRLLTWTIEAWVNPDSVSGGAGTILRRTVQHISGSNYAANYTMGLRSNGSGGLEAYAGYVLVNGTPYYVGGGTVQPGVWTHIAASYDSATAALSLMINGQVVTVSNNLNNAPPINGRGGDTFVRAGEDIDGSIDDIRLWSVARTTNQIAQNMSVTIDGATQGLVNYFRMDDAEAITNAVPFGEFHQPYGAQDFTYKKDWNQQWIHAASLHGTASFADVQDSGPVIIPPTVQVVLLPADVVSSGAQWSLNGGSWRSSEDIATASAGTNRITFRTITGWVTPQALSLILTNNMTLSTNIYYSKGGALNISLDPPEAISAGATWRVDGGDWQDSENTVSNLAPGSYLVEYSAVDSWDAPASEYVAIEEALTTELVREYVQERGSITAVISPSGVNSDGARWRVNAGSWQRSGTRVNVASGVYTVEYSSVNGWLKPQTVFVTISNGTARTITGTYYQYEYIGEFGYGSGQLNRPSGLAVDVSGNLYVSDTGNNRVQVRYPDGSWDIIGGAGAGVGQFNQPYGLTIAGDGLLYIADANNHRIQRYNLFERTWSSWGGSGTGLGQFNAPFDVALDAYGNLYVADRSNHRIQKMDKTGAWTQIINGGFGAGQVRYPRGLCIDANGYLYASDFITGTTNIGRIQKFNLNGSYIDVVASTALNKGILSKPAGIDVGAGKMLYIADNVTNACFANVLGNTNVTETLGASYLLGPQDVAVDRNGNVYIADTKHNRIVKLNIGGDTPFGSVETNQYVYRNDFDGDGKADETVCWTAGGWWYLNYSTGGTASKKLGGAGVVPACGDYDGDGKTDIVTYRGSDGVWTILYSSGGQEVRRWGWNETTPVPADYDGDGKTDLCVFYANGGEWYIQYSTGGSAVRRWGWGETEPVVGDYDGDHLADIAVYWPEQGKWFICRSTTKKLQLLQWGWSEALPVPGDYDGDGKADAGVYYAPTGMWMIQLSSTSSMYRRMWGWSEAIPVQADFDGDGRTDFAVFYANEGYWIILNSHDSSTTTLNWGWADTVPIY